MPALTTPNPPSQSREALRLTRGILEALQAGAPHDHWDGFWNQRERLVASLLRQPQAWDAAVQVDLRTVWQLNGAILAELDRQREEVRVQLAAVGETHRLHDAYRHRPDRAPSCVDKAG